jgi:GntR family transcriptional regulator
VENGSRHPDPGQLDDLYEFDGAMLQSAAFKLSRTHIFPMAADVAANVTALAHPLYRQVQMALTRKLATGDWKPGAAIPSETSLASMFNVSIGTIRKAVDALVAGNILVRRQGRGTFVGMHTEDRTLFYFFHIARKDGSKELPVHELLSFRKGKAEAEEALRLGVGRGTPTLRMQNALKLGGRPVIFDDIVVPAALFPRLDEDSYRERESTIYALYQARYRINVIRISERLSAAMPSATVAAVLGMPVVTPALVIRRVAYTYNDTPVEYRVSWLDTREHEYWSDLWKGDLRQ